MALRLIGVTTYSGDQDAFKLDAEESLSRTRGRMQGFMKDTDCFQTSKGVAIKKAREDEILLGDIIDDEADELTLVNPTEKATTDKETAAATKAAAAAEEKAAAEAEAKEKQAEAKEKQAEAREKRGEGLDPSAYKPELDEALPKDLERPTVTDTTPEGGLDSDEATDDLQVLTDLDKAQRATLLRANRVYEDKTTAGWVMKSNGQLGWASKNSLSYANARLQPEHGRRYDHSTFTYTMHESQWQQQTVGQSSMGIGVPLIFKVTGTYKNVVDRSKFDKQTRVYLQSSQMIPKVRLGLDGVQLSKQFIDEIRRATTAADPARELLDVLEQSGQFVALDMQLGGRITLWTTRDLSETHTQEKVLHQFTTAVDAKLTAEGVPVDVGGGGGARHHEASSDAHVRQGMNLTMELKGGDPAVASSKSDTLGAKWIKTLGNYKSWEVIGFHERSLIPTIDLLEPALRTTCRKILKDYFKKQLRTRHTDRLGGDEKEFADQVKDVRRLKKINIRWARVVDAIQTVQVLENNTERTSRWYGSQHKPTGPAAGEVSIELEPDEEIAAMEVQYESLVDHLVFWTTKDRRYPARGHYGGTGGSKRATVSGPRVRGLFGTAAALVDSLGLVYLDLDAGTRCREFLLAIEPYLFDDK